MQGESHDSARARVRGRNQLDEIALVSVSATHALPSEKRRLEVAHMRRRTTNGNEKHSRDTVNWIKRVECHVGVKLCRWHRCSAMHTFPLDKSFYSGTY